MESLTANFTAYPFEERASFKSNDADLDKIWQISWRTARLDAHETYMDTPYYEQLQYVGDTRIQALISYSVAGDDRLARQALEAFNLSRIPEGITRSRYPSSLPQNIPTFSLLWISECCMTTGCTGPIRSRCVLRSWVPAPSSTGSAITSNRTVCSMRFPGGALSIGWARSRRSPHTTPIESLASQRLNISERWEDAADLEKGTRRPDAGRSAICLVPLMSGPALYNKCWNASRGLIADTPVREGLFTSRPISWLCCTT